MNKKFQLKALFFPYIIFLTIYFNSCSKESFRKKNMYNMPKRFLHTSKIFGNTFLGLGTASIGYLGYDHFQCEKTSCKIFNQNVFLSRTNLDRRDNYETILHHLNNNLKESKPEIVTLQEFSNCANHINLMRQISKGLGYKMFYTPSGRRLKKGGMEKLCGSVILIDKERFDTSSHSYFKDNEEDKTCKNIFGLSALDTKTKENILILNVKAGTNSKHRRQLAENFKNDVENCEKKFNKKFTKIISAGDFNAFGDDEDLPRESYLNSFKEGMVSSIPGEEKHFYNPFDDNKEFSVSFFPDWTDGAVYKPILLPVKELKTKLDPKISINPKELSRIAKAIYDSPQHVNLNKYIDRSKLKGIYKKLSKVWLKIDFDQLMMKISADNEIGYETKILFVGILKIIRNWNPGKDLELNKKDECLIKIIYGLERICSWYRNPVKVDIINIASNDELIATTKLADQLIEIDKLLENHKNETKKKEFKENILFTKKVIKDIPNRPIIAGHIDTEENMKKMTLVSDHFSTITTYKKKSKLSKISDLINLYLTSNFKK